MTAFTITTAIIVVLGHALVSIVPIPWIRLGGGLVMLGFAGWGVRGLLRGDADNGGEQSLGKQQGLRAFFAIVAALALLDLAGDATEALIIVLVAQYNDLPFVFTASLSGLVAATAFESALGRTLGKVLTKRRAGILSVVVFLALGLLIILTG